LMVLREFTSSSFTSTGFLILSSNFMSLIIHKALPLQLEGCCNNPIVIKTIIHVPSELPSRYQPKYEFSIWGSQCHWIL
jgi:hypothetical protein